MSRNVLLVGCGEIGSRHLQAIASLGEVNQVEIVDERVEAHQLGQERLKEISDLNPRITFRWLRAIEEATPVGSLCIIATQAKGRAALMKKISGMLEYNRFLVEKVVTQSVGEYEDLLQFSRARNVRAWVNCKTRASEFHVRARRLLESDAPIQFSVFAGNHGLAMNGIHSVDLFVYYDRCRTLTRVGEFLNPVVQPTKRGTYDLSGTLSARSDRNSNLCISFASDHLAPPSYLVASSQYRFFLEQWDRIAYESTPGDNWTWRRVPFEENLLISHMSKRIVRDILTDDRCLLPTLEEAYPAHAFVLAELLEQFRKLMNIELDSCPIT